jgi:uncharacterized membrane protein YjgN (DUF898 family)
VTLAPPGAGPAAGPRRVALDITGSGAEVLRIWIVKLALTVATLGIYTARARVRTRRDI